MTFQHSDGAVTQTWAVFSLFPLCLTRRTMQNKALQLSLAVTHLQLTGPDLGRLRDFLFVQLPSVHLYLACYISLAIFIYIPGIS